MHDLNPLKFCDFFTHFYHTGGQLIEDVNNVLILKSISNLRLHSSLYSIKASTHTATNSSYTF